MTFGRPPSIPNDTCKIPLPQEIELEVLDNRDNAEALAQVSKPGSSTAAVYIHSM